ncbi:hypothetical protein [Thermodesulfovibrio hydrogeniphilus]
MNRQYLTPTELKRLGIEALSKALGPIGMVRFIQQFEKGYGDYTKEREQWLEEKEVEEVIKKIKDKKYDEK